MILNIFFTQYSLQFGINLRNNYTIAYKFTNPNYFIRQTFINDYWRQRLYKLNMEEETIKSNHNTITLYTIIQYSPQRFVSLACFNERLRLFEIGSFSDNEHYSNFQSLLIQMNPKQNGEQFNVHVSIKTNIKSEKNKIVQKLADSNFTIDEGSKNLNNQYHLALKFLLKKDQAMYLKDFQDKKALQALEKLMDVINLDKDETNKKQIDLQTLTLEKFMKMDKPVINALQIFPKDLDKKVIAGTNTLFQIVNKCKTQIGVRCLKRWMKQPLQDARLLNNRLQKVEFFIKNPVIRNLIQTQLKKIPDLDSLYHVFYKVDAGKKSNVEVNDLIKIYRTIKILEQLVKSLEQKGIADEQIVQMCKSLKEQLKIIDQIRQMVEDNIIMQERDSECHVRPDAQEILSTISKKQQKIRKKIDQHIKDIESKLGVQIEKVNSPTQRYILEADKKKSIQKIKQRGQYKYLTSKQNKITFTTDSLVGYCKDLTQLDEQYKQKQKQILKVMYKVVAGYYIIMEKLSRLLSQIDVLMGFSSVVNENAGYKTPWVKPHFTETQLVGEQIYHPCVLNCVPNNCDLSSHRTIILTGPNMGGKSTYIRTIGVAVYLAHIGCYVPAKRFQVPIIDSIITRVGASDMQIKGISTFMSQMIESSCMLHSATKKSLVLIDQLGRGTSTAEGFGIAWAICKQLHQKINPYCLFATHFHEMTRIQDQVVGVKNMHTSCKMNGNQLSLQYLILPGKMEQSYGIEVAKILKYPQSIINEAQNYLQLYERQKNNRGHCDTDNTSEKRQIFKKINVKEKQAIRLYKQMQMKLQAEQKNQGAIKESYKKKIREILA